MNNVKLVLFLMLSAIIAGCQGHNPEIRYDRRVDFSGLKTYAWLSIPEKNEFKSADIEHLKKIVNARLQAKGLAIDNSKPDFLISTGVGRAVGMENYNPDEGILTLNFIRPKSKATIWSGTVQAKLDPGMTAQQNQQLVTDAVDKILKKYPPPAKK